MAINQRKVRIAFSALLILCALAAFAVRTYGPADELVRKYITDGLFGLGVYLLIGIVQPAHPSENRGWAAFLIMAGMEALQLTNYPYKMIHSENALYQFLGNLIGTTFHWTELAAYVVGIWIIWFVDSRMISEKSP